MKKVGTTQDHEEQLDDLLFLSSQTYRECKLREGSQVPVFGSVIRSFQV